MNTGILEIRDAVANCRTPLLMVGGNVHDFAVAGKTVSANAMAFIEALTANKWPNCFRYDLFRGFTTVRASRAAEEALGIKEPEKGKKSASKSDVLSPSLKAMFDEAREGTGRETPAAENKVVPPIAAFRRLDTFFEQSREPTLVIITFPERLLPCAGHETPSDEKFSTLLVALSSWSQNVELLNKRHLLVVIGNRVQELFRELPQPSLAKLVQLPKPSEKEILDFITKRQEWAGIVKNRSQEMAQAVSGLYLHTIEEILQRTTSIDDVLNNCFAAKKRLIEQEYGDLLEVVKPRLGFEVIGGLQALISEFQSIALSMKSGRTALVPQGVLLMGPPGTGKTLFAEALAKDAGVNFVRLLDIKSKWVGDSEQRMSKMIRGLKEVAPVVTFVDEFDQNQGQRGGFDGDSGVSRNLFKKMLEVMGDPELRGRIVWIFATNRPDLLDPAIKRPGRCDLRIPLLLPDLERRIQILERAHFQFPELKVEVKNWRSVAERCDGYGGADLVEIVRRAWKQALNNNRIVAHDGDVLWALENYLPRTTDEQEVARMSLAALDECSAREFLPAEAEALRRNYQAVVAGASRLRSAAPTEEGQSRFGLLEID